MSRHRHLAHKLRRYYTRTGNELIFRNGLNLNQMADRMAESEVLGIEPASLSRFLSGDRLPQLDQLRVLCEMLDLSDGERWELEYGLAQDRCEEKGIELDINTSPLVVNLLLRDIAALGRAIDEGELNAALDMLHNVYQAKIEMGGELAPSVPLLRIISLTEIERTNLMYALSKSAWGDALTHPQAVQVWEYAQGEDTLVLPASLAWSELERRLWQRYYLDSASVAVIAEAEAFAEATVYAVLESVKSRLLQHLAERGDDQPSP